MKRIVTLYRKRHETQEWEAMGAFSFDSDGTIGEIDCDPSWIREWKMLSREAGHPVTHDSHPELWLKALMREYAGHTRKLSIETLDE